MGKYDGTTIEVLNWSTYNPRTDSKRPTWFRFDNSMATGSGFFGLDCEQKWLWVFILSLVSDKNGQPIVWNSSYAEQLTGINPTKQDLTIDIFVKFVRLRVSRKVTRSNFEISCGTRPLRTRRTNERTGRDETNEAGKPAQPLFEIWNQQRGGLPEARGCAGKRLRSAQARWGENPSTEYWAEIITRMSKSDFCLGKKSNPSSDHKNWKATFDFLIQPDTQFKVLEGKYDNRDSGSSVSAIRPVEELDSA